MLTDRRHQQDPARPHLRLRGNSETVFDVFRRIWLFWELFPLPDNFSRLREEMS